MAAPSKSFTVIPDASIDADSPWTADLVEDFRDNDIHLEEWLGGSYAAAVDHDHDGVNSKSIILADESLSVTKLIRATEVSFFDDFLMEVFTNGSDLTASSASVGTAAGADNGVISVSGGTAATRGGATQDSTTPWRLNTGVTIIFETSALGTGSGSTLNLMAGLWDGVAVEANINDEITFSRNTGTSKLQVTTRAGGTATQTDLDVDFSTSSYQRLTFIATPSQVLFYVDDVLKATHTTNIPSTSINMGLIVGLVGSGITTNYDYCFCHQDARN